jgi:hypothetical protein
VEVVRHVTDFSGPVMFVGNHPNSLLRTRVNPRKLRGR